MTAGNRDGMWPHEHDPSRRAFLRAAALLTGAPAVASAAVRRAAPRRALTAREVADRIRAGVGVPWQGATVDGFKAGDPGSVVTGIATVAVATVDVLRRAADAGLNFVVTPEPTFYAADDAPGSRASDPVYLAKRALIDERRLIVYRFADHWRARTPDATSRALAAAMGWTERGDDDRTYVVPATTVGDVVALARTRLGVHGGLRVIGDARAPVRRVLVSPGTVEWRDTVRRLPGVDLILAGEPREWEAVEYAYDAVAAGHLAGMVVLGRVISEGPGMRACAEWLRTLLPEVAVRPLAVADPYWSPTA